MPSPFRPIARTITRFTRPAPQVDATAVHSLLEEIKENKKPPGILITVNHYSAPRFGIWWAGIVISAMFPADIRWIVTSGWEEINWYNRLTHYIFPLGAKVLGFSILPGMPPNPAEMEQSAAAVRKIISLARSSNFPVIGIMPEGGDTPGGVLGELPAGVGRFMQLLSCYCPVTIPAGIWKDGDMIRVKFGAPYQLGNTAGLPANERDRRVGNEAMQHIAALLPERLWGRYRM